jgi:hypothetical protein
MFALYAIPYAPYGYLDSPVTHVLMPIKQPAITQDRMAASTISGITPTQS